MNVWIAPPELSVWRCALVSPSPEMLTRKSLPDTGQFPPPASTIWKIRLAPLPSICTPFPLIVSACVIWICPDVRTILPVTAGSKVIVSPGPEAAT